MYQQTLDKLKAKGFRLTPARKQIIQYLEDSENPISAKDILNKLSKNNLLVNKTTVYRELDFLISQDLIHQVDFGEGNKRYEFNRDSHHHHLICTRCQKVFEIDIDLATFENKLKTIEDDLSQQKNFTITHHSLEFFGLCYSCKS